MAKVTFDGSNRLIIVNYGITSLDVKVDLYSDWKEWVLLSDNSKYPTAMTAVGGDPLAGSQYLGTTYFLENGWKIRPYEDNHSLEVSGNLYARDGSSPFVQTLGSYNVLITLKTSNLVDTVNLAGTSVDINAIAEAVWKYATSGSLTIDTMGSHVYTKLMTFAQYMATK